MIELTARPAHPIAPSTPAISTAPRVTRWGLPLLFGALLAVSGEAAFVSYTDLDAGVGPGDARSNADAAAQAFRAAAGPLTTVDFEAFPTGDVSTLAIAPGVMLAMTDAAGWPDIATGGHWSTGFNTTAGGSQYLSVNSAGGPSAMATFLFGAPINSFGAYLTGVGTAEGVVRMTINSGVTQDYVIGGALTGGARYVGFTDVGASITSVSFSLTGGLPYSADVFGIDDAQFGVSTTSGPGYSVYLQFTTDPPGGQWLVTVPEPTTALFGAALLGFCGVARRRAHQPT